jgi:hypothetical protein
LIEIVILVIALKTKRRNEEKKRRREEEKKHEKKVEEKHGRKTIKNESHTGGSNGSS